MKRIDLVEWGGSKTLELTEEEYDTLVKLKVSSVTRKSRGEYSVKPQRHVGSVRFGDVQLNVRPKITEINRLLFFMGYCDNPAIWRDEFVYLKEADGLFPAVAESFIRLASRAIEQGLLQGYTVRADRLPVMRGKLQLSEQITRNFGLPLPLAVEYDDFTTDVVENKVILLATLRLLSLQEIGSGARQRLSKIRVLLDDITLPRRRSGTPRWTANRLNVRYHDVLRLSEVILDNSSFDQKNDTLAVSGFMFDMAKIYENFVTGALGMAMRQFNVNPRFQYIRYLDKASKLKIRPDLVWCDKSDNAVAVVDAKYKAERPRGFPEADLYQMLAYCSALNLKEGHLVYAKGNELPRTHEINNCGITVYCHALDLGLQPDELLKKIDILAHLILHKNP
ncbi:McrC family protein [Nocardia alni]|uniref:McrC family protein n=1 Tax=Nocardia alni TaxID=2815723 RepID=UPI001C247E84|nr:McrC family protein [Nocardia alni]